MKTEKLSAKSVLVGLAMAGLIMLIAYLLKDSQLYDYFSMAIGDGKGIAFAIFLPFLKLLEAIEVWSSTAWLWLLGIIVGIIIIYVFISGVLLNYQKVRDEVELNGPFPTVWMIYYFTLLGCCYGMQMLLGLTAQFYWYALFGGLAYLVLADLSYSIDMKSFLMVIFFYFPLQVIFAVIVLALGCVLSWIVLISLVVGLFRGSFSTGKVYRFSDGTKVEKKEGLFGDATYHDAAGNTYRETGYDNEVKKE